MSACVTLLYCTSLELVEEAINLVPRVLGLFGQRVSARRDSRIINSIFPENVGSGLIAYAYCVCLSLNGNRKEKTVNSGNGGLKVFDKQEF